MAVKNEKQYEALKDKGMSKQRAAKIANSPDASKHGGEKSHRGSGHADQGELLKWFSTLAPAKPKVYLTHGEDRGRGTLAKMIQQKFKLPSALPKQGEVIEV